VYIYTEHTDFFFFFKGISQIQAANILGLLSTASRALHDKL
jgi:hypothetical protein